MIKKLDTQHSILTNRAIPDCGNSCPLVDGGFTDNGPITPVLATSSQMDVTLWPHQLSLLGPLQTMTTIKYLLGTGPFGIWTATGLNLCPFTQISICNMITKARTLATPLLPFDIGEQYRSITDRYSINRPDKQVLQAFCSDPLIFDHFRAMCEGDSVCHMCTVALPHWSTKIQFTATRHIFMLTMLWLAPTSIATRFVDAYIPQEMLKMEYYSNMNLWFPDFVAVAPQKGGMGFTKPAGHSLLDYLTYLTQRLIASEVSVRMTTAKLVQNVLPTCGYDVFRESSKYNNHHQDQFN